MGRRRLFRRVARASPVMRWMKDSYQAKLAVGIFITLIISAYVFSVAEGVPIHEGLFISLILLFGESTDPVTTVGKIAVLVTMITGLIFFALIIGEVSSYLLDKIINRGKVKVLKTYGGSGHVVICGLTSKVEGIMVELRSEDLEQHYPVVIVSPNADNISFSDDTLRRNTFAIVGDPLDLEVLDKANVSTARSVLVLSTDETVKGKRLYRDAYVTLVYKTIYNHLADPNVSKKVKDNINVVLEFLDEGTNLLPCAKGIHSQPEVYTSVIPGTKFQLTVEPIYLENMPRYLFIQSIMEKDISDIIHDLLSTTAKDTCEFYYYAISKDMEGKSFYSVEKALLETGVTPIGVLRRSPAQGNGVVSGYEKADKVELLLNPEQEISFRAGDQLVLISYDERDARMACQKIEKGLEGFKQPALPPPNGTTQRSLPFRKVFILNWNPYQIRDLLTEMSKISMNVEKARGSVDRVEVDLLTKYEPDKLKQKLDTIKNNVSVQIGRRMEELIELKVENIGEPVTLESLMNAGISRDSAETTRVVMVSEWDEDAEADLKALHQLLIIENRISERIFTAVELTESKNFQFFQNTKADVVVSIEAFAEQLMAQAVLKPYVTLVFRNLLTFSENTNEFYIRDVPPAFVGRSIKDLQKALIGYPVILVGHTRPIPGKIAKSTITLNPKLEGAYDPSGPPGRVMKTDKFLKGDKVVIITRIPEMVDRVMGQLK